MPKIEEADEDNIEMTLEVNNQGNRVFKRQTDVISQREKSMLAIQQHKFQIIGRNLHQI